MARYKTYLCGPSDCPNDPAFEHDNYFGCVPKDFSPTTGRSKKYRQHRVARPDLPLGERYEWNGGCDAARAGSPVPEPKD
jgi:hypothetical protein